MTKALPAELKSLLLASPRRTLAAAESLTCGRVQALIGAVSGASEYFLGGVTAYSLDQKVKLLGVDRRHARAVNCVSARVADEMACGACKLFGSDLAVATTGYAEPSPAAGVAVPFAWWAIAARVRGKIVAVRHGRVECPGEPRTEVQRIVAEAVLAELAAYLR
jgi:nicotinamide-nucleotide amidase